MFLTDGQETYMKYKSTRSNYAVTASEAIVEGIAPDGGLFIPTLIPQIQISDYMNLSYKDLAKKVLALFLADFSQEEIDACVDGAYDEKFETSNIAEVKHLESYSVLELYHGRTLAFKDMALSILPYLMKTAAHKLGIEEEIVILTATSGDTGKAALEGFMDVDGTKIVVFYPSDGISDIQKRQMTTQEGHNTYVYGIKGNFDDAQSAVKKIFVDDQLKSKIKSKGYRFSSANSINIGRLIPQIVYYIYAYTEMLKGGQIKENELLNVVVPTGNFGNILAANYAKAMGLPIGKLICASNENYVLSEFFKTGVYDLERSFKVTNSPSMDILISSNLERYLAFIGEDVKEHMARLNDSKKYTLSSRGQEALKDYYGNYATEEETLEEINSLYQSGYLLDTHTAVASAVYKKYLKESNDSNKTLIVSTASPYKFTKHVVHAIAPERLSGSEFKLMKTLNDLTSVKIPKVIEGLENFEIKHPKIIEKTSIQETIESILR